MAKSFKIPKKIAGMKIPKAVRRSGRSLTAFLETPTGREVAAAALTAMAGVLAGTSRPVRNAAADAATGAGHTAAQAGSGAAGLMRDMAEAAVGAVSETARDLLSASKDRPQGARSGSKAH
ncbi:hypothetical protein [Azospirillum sp. TSO22-1]|uniref:hypothetical protein n=1 Tax=Azospirillum sp. TSO22-1 TaxID=716789 RepID=UPI000D615014|nr:hypothetical protein [Azospirillum sp. TSO22-1]PWC34983.1 hypothetical protein TSO221_30680 [Azospirillum sp. TSO22-1]